MKKYLCLAYNYEDDYAVSDLVELDPETIGDVPSVDNGAVVEAAKQIRQTRDIDWIARLWLIDLELKQVVSDVVAAVLCEILAEEE